MSDLMTRIIRSQRKLRDQQAKAHADARRRQGTLHLNRTRRTERGGEPLGYASVYTAWQLARNESRRRVTMPAGETRTRDERKRTRRTKRAGRTTAADYRAQSSALRAALVAAGFRVVRNAADRDHNRALLAALARTDSAKAAKLRRKAQETGLV